MDETTQAFADMLVTETTKDGAALDLAHREVSVVRAFDGEPMDGPRYVHHQACQLNLVRSSVNGRMSWREFIIFIFTKNVTPLVTRGNSAQPKERDQP